MNGLEIIQQERQRQIDEEGWTTAHDDAYVHTELEDAGDAYLYAYENGTTKKPNFWPWESSWWKPSKDDPIVNLRKAGALFMAERDRLERISGKRLPGLVAAIAWMDEQVQVVAELIDKELNKRK